MPRLICLKIGYACRTLHTNVGQDEQNMRAKCSYFLSFLSPRFFKKASGILQSPPSVRSSVTLSPPKPLDEIQLNLVCELLTCIGCATVHFFFGPAPWGPREGPKGQI